LPCGSCREKKFYGNTAGKKSREAENVQRKALGGRSTKRGYRLSMKLGKKEGRTKKEKREKKKKKKPRRTRNLGKEKRGQDGRSKRRGKF